MNRRRRRIERPIIDRERERIRARRICIRRINPARPTASERPLQWLRQNRKTQRRIFRVRPRQRDRFCHILRHIHRLHSGRGRLISARREITQAQNPPAMNCEPIRLEPALQHPLTIQRHRRIRRVDRPVKLRPAIDKHSPRSHIHRQPLRRHRSRSLPLKIQPARHIYDHRPHHIELRLRIHRKRRKIIHTRHRGPRHPELETALRIRRKIPISSRRNHHNPRIARHRQTPQRSPRSRTSACTRERNRPRPRRRRRHRHHRYRHRIYPRPQLP